jgi:hypothetical protein
MFNVEIAPPQGGGVIGIQYGRIRRIPPVVGQCETQEKCDYEQNS